MLQTWKNVLLRPGEEIFEQEKASPNATFGTAIIWIVIAAAISAALAYVGGMLWANAMGNYGELLDQLDLPPEMKTEFESLLESGLMEMMMGVGGILSLVLVPVIFLITTAFRHLLAKILKGQGSFGTYAYLCAAIEAPITIISGIVNLVPGIGSCISLLLMIYIYIERYYATKVAYDLSSGKAIAVVLIPILLVFAFIACAIIAIVAVAINAEGMVPQ